MAVNNLTGFIGHEPWPQQASDLWLGLDSPSYEATEGLCTIPMKSTSVGVSNPEGPINLSPNK